MIFKNPESPDFLSSLPKDLQEPSNNLEEINKNGEENQNSAQNLSKDGMVSNPVPEASQSPNESPADSGRANNGNNPVLDVEGQSDVLIANPEEEQENFLLASPDLLASLEQGDEIVSLVDGALGNIEQKSGAEQAMKGEGNFKNWMKKTGLGLLLGSLVATGYLFYGLLKLIEWGAGKLEKIVEFERRL